MSADLPDPDEHPRRPGAGGAGEDQSAAGDTGSADDWLAELLDHAAVKKYGTVPTEAAAAPRPGPMPVDGAAEADPASIGRYQVIRRLGQGGFGRVFLARDAELQRQVAIKVPITRGAGAVVDLELYLNEARVLARLSHPNIVPVHDVGRTDDGRGYVVSMFVAGGDLAARLKLGRPPFLESARLIAAICDAMHYAHTRDLFHRDIKPANILIDNFDVPYLADFGLAMKDEDYGKGPRFAGTVAYTSPEQARGEGHLVDGRSDIFSIGVVFYELLTGRRPFRGDTPEHLLRQITSTEPRPPRQIDDTIPRELERICLKAIAKRASERYSTGGDMADELRIYLKSVTHAGAADALKTPLPSVAAAAGDTVSSAVPRSGQSDSTARSMKVVPRGLCSFDEHDADFFLELLPGPRDREGLPDVLRFWKSRIQSTEAEKTFRVGLIYGPSGCGKSSLLKAGLLPLLGPRITPVYVEATARETEAGLLRGILKAVPELPGDRGLIEAIALLRRGRSLRSRDKVLLVLDQFEQWLFAGSRDEGAELITALRQCDGEHIQALCLVRDDFWMAATRFMRSLEIDLVPHRNVAAVDLFDTKHARKVLSAFGRAYESLPDSVENQSREQNTFLDQATVGLSEEGWIVPVRLALFAEMVKSKPWTPETLRDVGGMEGVGVTYLEDTFSSSRSSPEHRYHQKAAQAVLKSLLPETNSDIKGTMRSSDELLRVSGLNDRPAEFENLIRILDGDLRLITPVDLQSSSRPDAHVDAKDSRYYQLTHDYLVHSLRDWLTRKQKSTRRGRAELLLAERSTLWNARPDGHHLPSLMEWATIRLFVKSADWTSPQRRMMRRTGQKVAIRTVATAVALSGALVAGFLLPHYIKEAYDRIFPRERAHHLVMSLQAAEINQVPNCIAEMQRYRQWIDPELRTLIEQSAADPEQKFRASLALLPVDPSQVDYLSKSLIDAPPDKLRVLCKLLAPHSSEISPRLWAFLETRGSDDTQVLGAAGALAQLDANSPRWKGVAAKTAHAMVSVNPIQVSRWLEVFQPAEKSLEAALKETLQDKNRNETDRLSAMNYLVHYASDSPRELVDLLQEAGPKEFAVVFPAMGRYGDQTLRLLERAIRDDSESPPRDEAENDRRAERHAKAAVALFRMGQVKRVWPILVHRNDPRLRSFLIHWLARLGEDPLTIEACLAEVGGELPRSPETPASKPGQQPSDDPNRTMLFDADASIRRAILLIVGHFDPTHLGTGKAQRAVEMVLNLYRHDPDPGIHAAARWALSHWGQIEQVRQIDSALAQSKAMVSRRWSVNSAGQTMVHIDGPLKFRMGVAGNDPDYQNEVEHQRRIPRRFAIAATEVSISEFAEFWKTHSASFDTPQFGPGSDGNLPRAGVSWYMAAAYCNWLSEKEGKQPVYAQNDKGKFAGGMRCDARAFDLGGYRLPTEAEWEYACRAGTETSRYYGHSLALLRQYARLTDWEKVSLVKAGSLLPNDFGLFDMLGNVMEWCHDADYDYKAFANDQSSDYIFNKILNSRYCVMRGGSYRSRPPDAQSGVRAKYEPGVSEFSIGFRVARSLP